MPSHPHRRVHRYLSSRGTTFVRSLPLALCVLALSACGKPDYQTLDDGSGNFADLRGRHVLINYWAAWCKPCLTEIPELNDFAASHADSVVVLGVNYDGVDADTLRQQAEAFGIAFPVLLDDPAALLGYPRPQTLPSTYVLAPDGTLQTVLQGAQTEASLAAAIGNGTPPSNATGAGETP